MASTAIPEANHTPTFVSPSTFPLAGGSSWSTLRARCTASTPAAAAGMDVWQLNGVARADASPMKINGTRASWDPRASAAPTMAAIRSVLTVPA